jgi:hypothetical protein
MMMPDGECESSLRGRLAIANDAGMNTMLLLSTTVKYSGDRRMR